MLMHQINQTAKTIWLAIFTLALIAGIVFILKDNSPTAELSEQPISTEQETPANQQTPTETTSLPEELKLTVPFTSQAPTGNWDELHNEACEEASVIMAWAYFNDITSLPPTTVEAEITKLTKWQQDNYGYYLSITTPETARMAQQVYGLETEIKSFNADTIKQALAEGKLVIVPAQGQLLGNPNFTPPGPPYHMFVITGYYTENGVDYFITNDPGTRRGENYEYTFDTVEAAAGNYSHSTKEVNTLDKDIIIVSK